MTGDMPALVRWSLIAVAISFGVYLLIADADDLIADFLSPRVAISALHAAATRAHSLTPNERAQITQDITTLRNLAGTCR